MKKIIHFILLMFLSSVSFPVLAQKAEPVVDKATIKKVQEELKAQMPGAKIKTIKYDDGGVYVGECQKKDRHGIGTMFFASKNVFIGAWDSDTISGDGYMIYPNGDIYQGSLSNNQRSGLGTIKYNNGSEYSGQWKEDKRNGEGKLTVDKNQWKEGEWKDDLLIGGTWAWDIDNQLNGHWSDSGFEGQVSVSEGSYSYTGTCRIPGDSNINSSAIWSICEFRDGTLTWPKDGTISSTSKGSLSGNWGDSKILKNGSVKITQTGVTLEGEVIEGQFKGMIYSFGKPIGERFDGTFSSDGSFNGTYIVSIPGKGYCFKGKMEKSRPVEGSLVLESYEVPFKAEYPSSNQALIAIKTSNSKDESLLPYSDNIHLFDGLEQLSSSQNRSLKKSLTNQVFSTSFEDYPIQGIKQNVYWAFYEDGLAVRKWDNENFVRKVKEQTVTTNKPPKKHSASVCPTCHGTGETIGHGYTVDGHPYSWVDKCFLCNGTGRVTADNELANALKDFWEEVGTVVVENSGTKKQEIPANGFEIFTYSIEGRTIVINETGDRFKVSENIRNLVSQNNSNNYTALENGANDYSMYRNMADKYNPYTTFKLEEEEIFGIPYLSSQFYFGSTASFGNVLTYNAPSKQKVEVKNGLILSHEFNDGKGRITTDKNITKFTTKEVKVNSMSISTSNAMAGLGGRSRNSNTSNYSSSRSSIGILDGCTIVFITYGTSPSVNPPHTVRKL